MLLFPGQKHSSSPHICFPLALACKAQTHTSSHNFLRMTETVSARQKQRTAETTYDGISTPLVSLLWRSFTVTTCLPRYMLTSSDVLRDFGDRDKYVKKIKRTTDLSSSRTALAFFVNVAVMITNSLKIQYNTFMMEFTKMGR